eukprot:1387183-Amorphochlora_amoeboformis.AAC.1
MIFPPEFLLSLKIPLNLFRGEVNPEEGGEEGEGEEEGEEGEEGEGGRIKYRIIGRGDVICFTQ